MSADNYIVIYPGGKGYQGHMGFMSDNVPDRDLRSVSGPPLFDVATEDEADMAADELFTEYGWWFFNPSENEGNDK